MYTLLTSKHSLDNLYYMSDFFYLFLKREHAFSLLFTFKILTILFIYGKEKNKSAIVPLRFLLTEVISHYLFTPHKIQCLEAVIRNKESVRFNR